MAKPEEIAALALALAPDDFPFISKGVPPGYKPGPTKFHTKG